MKKGLLILLCISLVGCIGASKNINLEKQVDEFQQSLLESNNEIVQKETVISKSWEWNKEI